MTELATVVNHRTFGNGATLLSVLGLVLGAAGIFNQLDRALNDIWSLTTVRPATLGERMILLRHKVAPYIVLFFVGLMFTSSVPVDSMLVSLASRLARFFPGFLQSSIHIDKLYIPALAFSTFYIILKWLPDARSRGRDIAIGALLTTALFLIGRQLMNQYLERGETASLFGSVGDFVVLLVWVYYSAQVLLFGAEFTKLYADRFGQTIEPRRMTFFRNDAEKRATSTYHSSSEQ